MIPPPLEPDARIGGYELVRRIGVGGMAEVWVARRVSERRANKYVAIKVVADQFVGDPRFQRMFKTEVELSALLNHVNIVQVFDEGEDGGRSYLVMEWVDGVNLLKVEAALSFVDDEAWRLRIITYVIGQLLYALHYAHSITLHDGDPLGIVHRDVSPQNVLVSAQGEVKLTDFGVAHYLLEESSGMHVKGKLRYMAPEQLGGHTRDPRIDLYAVGTIFHEMLDGRRFRYHVEDQREMYVEVISGQIPPLSRRVPPELDALRLGLLEPEPERRIPTADAALDRLMRFAGYGDARRELAQLCGGLTGVLRPRIGPGKSGASRAASPRAASSAVPAEAGRPVGVSTTLRAAEAGRPGGERLELEPTQQWIPTATPSFVPTATSARLRALAEETERMPPPTAEPGPDARATARSRIPWVLLGVVVTASVASGASWMVLERSQPRAAAEGRSEHASDAAGAPAVVVEAAEAEPSRTVDEAVDATQTGDEAAEPSRTSDEAAESGTTGGHDAASTGQATELGAAEPAEPAEPAKPAPRPKQALSIVAVAALGTVQVELRSKDGDFKRRYEFRSANKGERIAVGTYWVKWRPKDGSPWSKRQRVVLRRGCDLRLVLKPEGMTPVAMGSACR